MARAVGRRVDIRDVVAVHRLYNMAWRQHVKFPTTGAEWEHENRLSDSELWNQGKPALTTKGTMGDGYTELRFTFQNKTEQEADSYVKSFIDMHRLPFTYYKVSPARDLKGSLLYEPGEHIPKYVVVRVRFEEDEVTNARTKSLREARYHDPNTIDKVHERYKQRLAPYVTTGMYHTDDRHIRTDLELDGHPVRVSTTRKTDMKHPWDSVNIEYLVTSFLFLSQIDDPQEAMDLVKKFLLEDIKLPVTRTDWELEVARYDKDRVHTYKPTRVYAFYNPENPRIREKM